MRYGLGINLLFVVLLSGACGNQKVQAPGGGGGSDGSVQGMGAAANSSVPDLPSLTNDRCPNPFSEPDASSLVKPSQLVRSSGKWVAVSSHSYFFSREKYPEAAVYNGLDARIKEQLKESLSQATEIDFAMDLKRVKIQNGPSQDVAHKVLCSTIKAPVNQSSSQEDPQYLPNGYRNHSSQSSHKSSGNQNLNSNLLVLIDASSMVPVSSGKMEFHTDGRDEQFSFMIKSPESNDSLIKLEGMQLPENIKVYFIKADDNHFKLRIASVGETISNHSFSYDDSSTENGLQTSHAGNSVDLKLPTQTIIVLEADYVLRK